MRKSLLTTEERVVQGPLQEQQKKAVAEKVPSSLEVQLMAFGRTKNSAERHLTFLLEHYRNRGLRFVQ